MGQLIEKEVEQLKDRFQFSAEMIEKMEEAERYYFFPLLLRQSILRNRGHFERAANDIDFRAVATEKKSMAA